MDEILANASRNVIQFSGFELIFVWQNFNLEVLRG